MVPADATLVAMVMRCECVSAHAFHVSRSAVSNVGLTKANMANRRRLRPERRPASRSRESPPRLRSALMTLVLRALVYSYGALEIYGAEVQCPLASVVVGAPFTSSLLDSAAPARSL